MIFVDTSAWYARFTPRNPHHIAARSFHLHTSERLVTTDYVIDETLTLFKARGNARRAFQLAPRFFDGHLAELIWVEKVDVANALATFLKFGDKQWSSTDCISYVVMQRLGIRSAFAYDTHFTQFGFVQILPA